MNKHNIGTTVDQAMVYRYLFHARDQRVYGDQYRARDPAYPKRFTGIKTLPGTNMDRKGPDVSCTKQLSPPKLGNK